MAVQFNYSLSVTQGYKGPDVAREILQSPLYLEAAQNKGVPPELFSEGCVTTRSLNIIDGMRSVSESFPDLVFCLQAETDEEDLPPVRYYFNHGNFEECSSELVFKEPSMFHPKHQF